MKVILESKLSKEFVPILVCAASSLDIPILLSVPNVDDIFPVSGEAIAAREEFNCSIFAFNSKSQEELWYAIQEPLHRVLETFMDPQIGIAFNSANQCIAASNLTNIAAYHELIGNFKGRGYLFERFTKYVQELMNVGKYGVNNYKTLSL